MLPYDKQATVNFLPGPAATLTFTGTPLTGTVYYNGGTITETEVFTLSC